MLESQPRHRLSSCNITCFSSIPPGGSRNAALKQATTISFNFLSNSVNLSIALKLFVGPEALFQFLDILHSR
jgi:hypothetical protein